MRLFTILLLSTLSSAVWSADIESIAREIHPLFSSSHWGMHVVDSESRQVLHTHNASQLFIPASVAKLFTTAAALETLGSSHVFYTRVIASTSPNQQGEVKGDLYLVGGGDSSLTSEKLHELARRVYEAGVRTIMGMVIADDSLLGGCSLPTHAEWEDLSFAYAVEESALSVNSNRVEIVVCPNASGVGPADVQVEQEVPYCHLIHRVMTDRNIENPSLEIARGLTDNIIEVRGVVPPQSKPVRQGIAVHQPQEFAKALFIKALQDHGIQIMGAIQTHKNAESDNSYEIASIASVPLLATIDRINRHSENLPANLLFKYMNKQELAAISSFLRHVSIVPDRCQLCDGSGLSRHNLLSPAQTVRLLEYMHDGSYRLEFLNSLACSGASGSLATRFTPDAYPEIVVKAKTGSMSGISNLAGYLHLSDGRRLIFAIFINGSLWSRADTSEALDRLLWHICH